MAISYYTSFVIDDAACEDARYVSGVLELKRPLERSVAASSLKSILASGMNVDDDDIQLICWSPLH